MKRISTALKSAIVGGFVVLLPIAIVVLMVQQMIDILLMILKPVAEALPFGPAAGVWLAYLAAIVIILVFCCLTGFLVQMRFGAFAKDRLESLLLERLPGYTMIRNLTQRVTGTEGVQFSPAVVDLYGSGAQVLALIVESNDDGSYTVFVPTSPTPTLGQVYRVPGERVALSSAGLGAVIDGLTRWGDKSEKLFEVKS